MQRLRHVALIVDAADPYDRKIITGVGAYVKEVGNWSLYVETDPLKKLPDLHRWQGHGIIADFDDAQGGGGRARLGHSRGRRRRRLRLVRSGHRHPLLRQRQREDRPSGRRASDRPRFPPAGLLRLSPHPRQRLVRGPRPGPSSSGPPRRAIECSVYTGRHETARKWRDLQRGLTTWLRSLKTPVGLMGCNDAGARHVLEACRTIGRGCPKTWPSSAWTTTKRSAI